MKTPVRLWSLVFALSLPAAAALAAAPAPPAHGPAPAPGQLLTGPDEFGPGFGYLAHRLDLGPDQVTRLRALHREQRAALAPIRAELIRARADIAAEAQGVDPNVAAIEKAEAKIDRLRADMRKERRAFRLKAIALLRPEQAAELPGWFKAGLPGPGPHRGKGFGRGMGPAGDFAGCPLGGGPGHGFRGGRGMGPRWFGPAEPPAAEGAPAVPSAPAVP